MILNIRRLIITISYLKFIQIYTRIYFKVRQIIREFIGFQYLFSLEALHSNMKFSHTLTHSKSYDNKKFIFLNISVCFSEQIDWNYKKNGKLWTYNLSYFDFLHQEKIDQDIALALMIDYVNNMQYIDDGLDPFPISIRGINWIKYLSIYGVNNKLLNDSLYAQYYILLDNLEYHLLGNHLLENGFSLLFGSYYFKDEKLYKTAKKILVQELEEQILHDGAHFELSPMYHQIMLYRVLDCITLVQKNSWKNQELLALLQNKAKVMLGWLNTVTFENGVIPLFNDSSCNIAPSTKELNLYAEQLRLKQSAVKLKESGYRKIKKDRYECIIDVGNIGPDYIPGHAHSDTFNFILHVEGSPLIVDTGLSTYEPNQRRMVERSTSSHNTVEVDGLNQSEVWGGFKVARRAKIIHLDENSHIVEATHNGYKHIGVLHTRKFTMNERSIVIEDRINSVCEHQCIAYLHFYPKVRPVIKGNKIIIDQTEIVVNNAIKIEIEAYQYAPEFNKLINALKVKIAFKHRLVMEIKL